MNCFYFFQKQFKLRLPHKIILLALFCSITLSSHSQCVTAVQPGSFIINMGSTPQTYQSGLLPYGMIYELVSKYNVPVLWCIKPSKVKDGADFTYNFQSYSGGTFIVPVQFINPTVSGRITYWLTQGVQGTYAIAGAFTPPIYDTLTSFPRVMIDNGAGNQTIIMGYYANAGIPDSSYVLGLPSSLNSCFDIWTNPHDAPTWASHSHLYNFIAVLKGNIWAQCREVSVMENCQNPVFPFQQMNFLTSTGLQCYAAGQCGAAAAHATNPILPETYSFPTDPIMQFIGTFGGATTNALEEWYIPRAGGQWNVNTKRAVKTGNGSAPAEGVLLAYGPAYGNPANGTIMYESGHDYSTRGTVPEQVAAQRAYFNFVLLTGKQKKLAVSTTVPSSCNELSTNPITANVTSGVGPYTYQWSSLLGGTFSNSASANTDYTAPSVAANSTEILTIKVTDACGRSNFKLLCFTVNQTTLPVELLSFSAVPKENAVNAEWSTATEINNDYFTLERSEDASSFHDIAFVDGAGNSTYKHDYSYLDRSPVAGLSYYRLKQTDFDGQTSYSDIVPVKYTGSGFVVYPNPAYNRITILASQNRKDKILVQLVDFSGRVVLNEYIAFEDDNSNRIDLDVSNYTRGVYRLICTTDEENFVEPIVLR